MKKTVVLSLAAFLLSSFLMVGGAFANSSADLGAKNTVQTNHHKKWHKRKVMKRHWKRYNKRRHVNKRG